MLRIFKGMESGEGDGWCGSYVGVRRGGGGGGEGRGRGEGGGGGRGEGGGGGGGGEGGGGGGGGDERVMSLESKQVQSCRHLR